MLMMHSLNGLGTFVLIVLAFGVIFVAATVIHTARFQLRLRRIDGMTRPDFIKFFAVREGGSRVAECVFDEYRSEAYFSPFKLSPKTDLAETFDQESEEIRETAIKIAEKLGSPQLTEENLRIIQSEAHFTAEKMVELLLSHHK